MINFENTIKKKKIFKKRRHKLIFLYIIQNFKNLKNIKKYPPIF